ncbi:hypothetical protein Tco_0304626 [Tanacetum coccineum]
MEEVKARLNFGDARKKSTKAQESAYSESRTISPRRQRRSRSPRHNPSVFTRLRRERSRSPRHEYKNKERRESTVFKRLGSRGRNSEGGHWKSKLQRKKSSVEDDDLFQAWVCAETNPFTSRIRHFDFPKTRMPNGELLNGELLNGELLNGELLNGELLNGELLNGELPNGELPNGELLKGTGSECLKKEALHTTLWQQKPGQYICCQNHMLIADIENESWNQVNACTTLPQPLGSLNRNHVLICHDDHRYLLLTSHSEIVDIRYRWGNIIPASEY